MLPRQTRNKPSVQRPCNMDSVELIAGGNRNYDYLAHTQLQTDKCGLKTVAGCQLFLKR